MIEKDVGRNTSGVRNKIIDRLGGFKRQAEQPGSSKFKALRDYVVLSREKIKAESLRNDIIIGHRDNDEITFQIKYSRLAASDIKIAMFEVKIEERHTQDHNYNQDYSFIASTIRQAETTDDPEIKEAIVTFKTWMFMLIPQV